MNKQKLSLGFNTVSVHPDFPIFIELLDWFKEGKCLFIGQPLRLFSRKERKHRVGREKNSSENTVRLHISNGDHKQRTVCQQTLSQGTEFANSLPGWSNSERSHR